MLKFCTRKSTPIQLNRAATSLSTRTLFSLPIRPSRDLIVRTAAANLQYRPTNSSNPLASRTMADAAPNKPIEPVEAAKRAAAHRAVKENFPPDSKYVGIGSGTTIVYVVEAVKALATNPKIQYVPTGYHSRQVIVAAGLTAIAFDSLPPNTMLDVAFDGADEVDEDLNCVKGGGACLFQEKLVAMRSRRFICVADYRKDQTHLLSKWPSIPIEVVPIATHVVLEALRELGSKDPKVRENSVLKSGPIKTDQDNFIIDAPFSPLRTEKEMESVGPDGSKIWDVESLAIAIKLIPGVLEVGLFCGVNGIEAEVAGLHHGGQKPVAAYFGAADGTVKVRKSAALTQLDAV